MATSEADDEQPNAIEQAKCNYDEWATTVAHLLNSVTPALVTDRIAAAHVAATMALAAATRLQAEANWAPPWRAEELTAALQAPESAQEAPDPSPTPREGGFEPQRPSERAGGADPAERRANRDAGSWPDAGDEAANVALRDEADTWRRRFEHARRRLVAIGRFLNDDADVFVADPADPIGGVRELARRMATAKALHRADIQNLERWAPVIDAAHAWTAEMQRLGNGGPILGTFGQSLAEAVDALDRSEDTERD